MGGTAKTRAMNVDTIARQRIVRPVQQRLPPDRRKGRIVRAAAVLATE
jgi:hypothetical protein